MESQDSIINHVISRDRGRGHGRDSGSGRGRGHTRGNSDKIIYYELNPEKLRVHLPDEKNNVTPEYLKEFWKSHDDKILEYKIITFYSEKHILGCFSNFFSNMPPYEFDLPVEILKIPENLKEKFKTPVIVTNSEKTIMLCKAALFGDYVSYKRILKTENPKYAKTLGRKVKNFDQKVWYDSVCNIAKEIVYQKFLKSPEEIRNVLKSTGNNIIVEAAPGDNLWGVGMNSRNEAINTPSTWNGINILGYALMEARFKLFSN